MSVDGTACQICGPPIGRRSVATRISTRMIHPDRRWTSMCTLQVLWVGWPPKSAMMYQLTLDTSLTKVKLAIRLTSPLPPCDSAASLYVSLLTLVWVSAALLWLPLAFPLAWITFGFGVSIHLGEWFEQS